MAKLIQDAPDIAVMILDLCIKDEKTFSHRSSAKVERITRYWFFPFKRKHRKSRILCVHLLGPPASTGPYETEILTLQLIFSLVIAEDS